jgi:hypothetical protein
MYHSPETIVAISPDYQRYSLGHGRLIHVADLMVYVVIF